MNRYDWALAVFLIAGATDFADGYVARRFNQRSEIGRLLDPIADKVLVTSAFVAMAVPHNGFPSVPIWLAVSVVARDVLILLGALLVYLMSRFSGFSPTWSGKLTTFAELAVIAGFLLFNSLGRFVWTLPYMYAIVLACVMVSGIEYLFRAVRMLKSLPR